MSENGENYTTGKNFTLPPAVTILTNLTSGGREQLKLVCAVNLLKSSSWFLFEPGI